MGNAYAESARTKKAIAICDALAGAGYRSSDAAGFGPAQWQLAADLARQKFPSEETQALVVKMLREREKAISRFGETREQHA